MKSAMTFAERKYKARELLNTELEIISNVYSELYDIVKKKMALWYNDFKWIERDYFLTIKNFTDLGTCNTQNSIDHLILNVLYYESVKMGLSIHTFGYITEHPDAIIIDDLEEEYNHDETIVRFDESIAEDDHFYISNHIVCGINAMDSLHLLMSISKIYSELLEESN